MLRYVSPSSSTSVSAIVTPSSGILRSSKLFTHRALPPSRPGLGGGRTTWSWSLPVAPDIYVARLIRRWVTVHWQSGRDLWVMAAHSHHHHESWLRRHRHKLGVDPRTTGPLTPLASYSFGFLSLPRVCLCRPSKPASVVPVHTIPLCLASCSLLRLSPKFLSSVRPLQLSKISNHYPLRCLDVLHHEVSPIVRRLLR